MAHYFFLVVRFKAFTIRAIASSFALAFGKMFLTNGGSAIHCDF